ncbi:MAG: M48 family metalloprotease, partial [Deltaproteobacteria bacterium]
MGAWGCRSAPRTGADEAPPKPPPPLDTPYADEDVGREAAEQAGAQLGEVRDPELSAYVNAIGQRLAHHAPGFSFDYRFTIIDEDTPNAFALPGGYVFVSRGLLALSNSEAEIAGVLGHEIAHVALRHAAARQRVGGSGVMQLLQMPYLAAYDRRLEHSADRVGQGLAAVAGYDPDGISGFLQSLDAYERVRSGASRIPSFFDTHPGAVGRAADTAQRAQGIRWNARPGFSTNRDDYLRRLDGLVVGQSGEQGIFQDSRFLHADLAFTLRFPDEWDTINTPQAVGALSPDRQAQVFLEAASAGEDAAQAAAEWVEEGHDEGLRVFESASVKLAGRQAHRITGSVRGAAGSIRLVATFIPWRGRIYRLIGVSASGMRHDAMFVSVARSFRPMTPELLAQVRETRLRLAEARAGETLAELSKRTGNVWSLPLTAVLNDRRSDHRFAGGELVKVGRSEPYGQTAPEGVARDAGPRT